MDTLISEEPVPTPEDEENDLEVQAIIGEPIDSNDNHSRASSASIMSCKSRNSSRSTKSEKAASNEEGVSCLLVDETNGELEGGSLRPE